MIKIFIKETKKDQNFFLWVNYGFDEFVMESLKCKKYEKIQEYYFNSRRLYSIKPDKKRFYTNQIVNFFIIKKKSIKKPEKNTIPR